MTTPHELAAITAFFAFAHDVENKPTIDTWLDAPEEIRITFRMVADAVLTVTAASVGGLPIHMPIGVNKQGEGPCEPETPHHRVCWCSNPNCMWTTALAKERARQ